MHRLTPPGLVLMLLAVFCAPVILFAVPPAERAYRVTLQPGEALDGPRAVAEQMAATYGGTLGEAGALAGDGFVVRLSESRARVLSADPRVKSVVPMGPGTAAASAVVEAVAWSSGVSYSYDGAGNVKQVGSDRFAYDDVNRLVQATVNGVTRKYEYDAFGNRTGCTQFGQNDCQAFTINTAENKNRIAQVSYDAAGNVIAQSNHAYSYDALNMMTRDTYGQLARELVYTADDERIATYTVGSSWRWTVRDTSGKVLREFSSADAPGGLGTANWKWEKDYLWRDGLLLASRQPDGAGTTTYHYHLDHLGTPRRITDNSDQIVGVHDYFAFGPEASTQVQESSLTSLKYTGHERDGWSSESSDTLDYMHARYYSPWLGRFLSVDLAPPEPKRPQSWNRYSYVLNNPLLYTDPTGNIYELYGFVNDADEQKLWADLSAKTGLTVTNNNGKMDYARDANGNAVVATDANGNRLGSATARADLMAGINSTNRYIVQRTDNNPNVDMGVAQGSLIRLDFADMRQINTGNNPSATFDSSMIFLHEGVGHAFLGLHDPAVQMLQSNNPLLQHQTGPTVNWENRIRSQLSLPLRSQYRTEVNPQGKRYIPFANGPVWLP